MINKITKNIWAIISWFFVSLWMILIFFLSAQPAQESKQLSLGITGIIIRFIRNLAIAVGTNPNKVNEINHIVRKSAHAFLYFVLAMLMVNAFYKTKINGFKAFIFAFIGTALYACTDEIHQLFVPGRGCMLLDVGIDSVGAFLGLCTFGLCFGIYNFIMKRRQKVLNLGYHKDCE